MQESNKTDIKPTYITEVRTLSSKPSSKDIPNKSNLGGRREPPKTSISKPKKESEQPKHEYVNALDVIVSKQAEQYMARFQSNNKDDIQEIMDRLENYPIYSLHRERTNKLRQFGVMYARLLNLLTSKRAEMEKKCKALEEILDKLRFMNNKVPQEVFFFIKFYNK